MRDKSLALDHRPRQPRSNRTPLFVRRVYFRKRIMQIPVIAPGLTTVEGKVSSSYRMSIGWVESALEALLEGKSFQWYKIILYVILYFMAPVLYKVVYRLQILYWIEFYNDLITLYWNVKSWELKVIGIVGLLLIIWLYEKIRNSFMSL